MLEINYLMGKGDPMPIPFRTCYYELIGLHRSFAANACKQESISIGEISL